ncbi:MAG: enoyl-CoA hydratase-related protein, partial [Burkholderiales bacterium]
MTYQNILLETPEAGVHLLTVNRPKALNALNSATLDEIGDAVKKVGADENARVLLLTGAGDKAFVAGADISAMQNYTPLQAKGFSEKGLLIFRGLELLPIPVIALVNGYCLGGGCELALSCDFILASERAVFGQPEVNLGIMAGFGGSQRLPRLVGRALGLELLFTGRQVIAAEAMQIRLANHVYS